MDYSNSSIKLKRILVEQKNGHNVEIDHNSPIGRCPICNELVEEPIHETKNYRVTRISRGIPANTSVKFVLVSPDTTTRVHLVFSAVSENPVIREFFEDATLDGGDKMDELDNNRDNPTHSELFVFENPLGDEGTKLYERRVTNGLDRVLTNISLESEIILKQNTIYLIKLTPEIDSTISTVIRWIEIK